MKTLGLYLLSGLAIGVIAAIMGWPMWGIWVGLGVLLVINLALLFYTVYQSKNVTRIGRFIDNYGKNPVYRYMHLLREGTNEQLIAETTNILAKYKQPKYQAIYGVNKALLSGDLEEARKVIKPIMQTEIGQYTKALIEALAGNEQEVFTYNVTKPWMLASLKANIAFAKGDHQSFNQEANRAVSLSRGIQYYGNYYTFRRMKEAMIQKEREQR